MGTKFLKGGCFHWLTRWLYCV